MKLKNHPYANCSVRVLNDGSVVFTRKQIGWFLKEYVPQLNYYDIKSLYWADRMLNIHTGELKKAQFPSDEC